MEETEPRCGTCKDTHRVQRKLDGSGVIPSNEVSQLPLADQMKLVGTAPGLPCPDCCQLPETPHGEIRMKSEEAEASGIETKEEPSS